MTSSKLLGTAAAAALVLGLAACGGGSAGDGGGMQGNGATAPSQPTSPPVTVTATTGTQVSKSQAGKIVTDKYGGTVKSVEDDTHHGTPVWEVEVKNSKKGRIEVDVGKAHGKILEVETD